MAVVKDFYVHGCCHVRIHDDYMLPKEEREAVIHRLEQIVIRDRLSRAARERHAKEKSELNSIPQSDE